MFDFFSKKCMKELIVLKFLKNVKHQTTHCVKSIRIRSFSGPFFAEFGLNPERYVVSLLIQSECGKIQTSKTANTDTSYAVVFSTKHE